MTMRLMKIAFFFLVTGLASSVFASEVITIESTITGSQEQPKVISIVPWQPPADPDYLGQEIQGLGFVGDEEEFIDRDAFNRELNLISSMRRGTQN